MAAFIVRDKSANDSAHLLKLDVSGKRGTIIAGYCKTLNAFLSWTILLITGEFEYNQQQKKTEKKREQFYRLVHKKFAVTKTTHLKNTMFCFEAPCTELKRLAKVIDRK